MKSNSAGKTKGKARLEPPSSQSLHLNTFRTCWGWMRSFPVLVSEDCNICRVSLVTVHQRGSQDYLRTVLTATTFSFFLDQPASSLPEPPGLGLCATTLCLVATIKYAISLYNFKKTPREVLGFKQVNPRVISCNSEAQGFM